MIKSKHGVKITHSGASESSFGSACKALKSLALLLPLSVSLTACAGIGGTTYGTGESQEAELLKDVTSGFGLLSGGEKKQPIDYSARAGLVLPPKGAALPQPQKRGQLASNAATNWPQDPDELRKLYQQKMANMTEAERKELLEIIRKLPPEQRNAIYKNDASAFAQAIEEPDYSKGIDIVKENEYRKQVLARRAIIENKLGTNTKGRKYLTQPPESITDVTPEVQREIDSLDPDEKKKDKNLLQRIWPF